MLEPEGYFGDLRILCFFIEHARERIVNLCIKMQEFRVTTCYRLLMRHES
jgi:hypothetical protein